MKAITTDERRAEVARLEAERDKVTERLSTSAQREEDAAYEALKANMGRPATVIGGPVQKIRKEREKDRAALEGLERDIRAHQRVIVEAEEQERRAKDEAAHRELAQLHGQLTAVWTEQALPAFRAFVEASNALQDRQMAVAEASRWLGLERPPMPTRYFPADVAALFDMLMKAVEPGRYALPVDSFLAEHLGSVELRAGSYHGDVDVRRTEKVQHTLEAASGVRGSFQSPVPADRGADLDVAREAAAAVVADALGTAWAD